MFVRVLFPLLHYEKIFMHIWIFYNGLTQFWTLLFENDAIVKKISTLNLLTFDKGSNNWVAFLTYASQHEMFLGPNIAEAGQIAETTN